MTDERKGLPSISGLERLAKCPGSWSLWQYVVTLYGEKKKSSKMAESGTRVHKALSDGDGDELSRYEEWTADACRRYEERLLAQLEQEYEFKSTDVFRESRYYLRIGRQIIGSGQADLIHVSKKSKALLVVDYKSGSMGSESADLNWQLSGYAVLAARQKFFPENTKVTYFIAIIQPNAPEKISVAVLSSEEVAALGKKVVSIITDALNGSVKREADIDGHCKYCPAKAFCPEYGGASRSAVMRIGLPEAGKAEIASLIELEPIENVIKMYEMRGTLAAINEAVADRIKRQLSVSADSVPGYKLGSSGSMRTITSPELAWGQIKPLVRKGNGSSEAFKKLLKLGVGDLEKFHKEVSGLKGQELEEDFKSRFSEVIAYVPKEPQIKKI